MGFLIFYALIGNPSPLFKKTWGAAFDQKGQLGNVSKERKERIMQPPGGGGTDTHAQAPPSERGL